MSCTVIEDLVSALQATFARLHWCDTQPRKDTLQEQASGLKMGCNALQKRQGIAHTI